MHREPHEIYTAVELEREILRELRHISHQIDKLIPHHVPATGVSIQQLT